MAVNKKVLIIGGILGVGTLVTLFFVLNKKKKAEELDSTDSGSGDQGSKDGKTPSTTPPEKNIIEKGIDYVKEKLNTPPTPPTPGKNVYANKPVVQTYKKPSGFGITGGIWFPVKGYKKGEKIGAYVTEVNIPADKLAIKTITGTVYANSADVIVK